MDVLENVNMQKNRPHFMLENKKQLDDWMKVLENMKTQKKKSKSQFFLIN